MKEIENFKLYNIKWVFSRNRYRKIIQIYLKLHIDIRSTFIHNISLALNHLNIINSISIDQ